MLEYSQKIQHTKELIQKLVCLGFGRSLYAVSYMTIKRLHECSHLLLHRIGPSMEPARGLILGTGEAGWYEAGPDGPTAQQPFPSPVFTVAYRPLVPPTERCAQ